MTNPHDSVLLFPARYIRALPLETRFVLQLDGTKQKIVVSSSEVSDPAEAGVLFDGIELGVLVEGVESGRVWPADVAEWVRRKRIDPSYRVTRDDALGDVAAVHGRPLDLCRVLAHLGLTLESVEVIPKTPFVVAVDAAA